jgi:hypothetical protein
MSEQITNIQKQTFRYYYQDGVVELVVGILFAVIGFNTLLISIAPGGSTLLTIAWIALPILTIGGVIGVQRLVKDLKERLVYPRTGFISYSTEPNPYRWLVTGGGLLLVLAVVVLPYEWLNRESVAGGTLMFITLVAIGAQVDLRRLILIGIMALALGLGLAFLPGSEHAGLSLTFAGAGLALLLSGGLALRRYLAENPLPEDPGDSHA